MDRRTLFVMIAASWIIVVFMMFNAPKPKAAGQNEAKQNEKSEQEKRPEDSAEGKSDQDQQAETDAKDDAAEKQPDDVGSNPEDKIRDQDTSSGSSKESDSSALPEPEATADSVKGRRQLKQQFISLGSLAADSPCRFLVTLDNQAASIHRLELVQRRRQDDKLLYKDLEVRYGYLGHLDLETSDTGQCQVKTVGKGTPADLAGIRVGDTISKFDEQEIQSRIDFEKALRSTKPGQQIKLEYLRNGVAGTATANLMRQPLEVIRPTIVPDQAMFAFEKVDMRKSFAVSIFRPTGSNWEKIGNAHEEVWDSEVAEDFVKFYYPYQDKAECLGAGFDYQVVKTFRIKPVAEEDRDNVDAMDYHLDFDIEITNLGEEPKSFAYRIDGPNGLPTEDWWFAIKIHGEWSAVFTQAGARDVVASTASKSFHFIGGPKIYTNGTKESQRTPIYVIDPGNDNPNAHLLKYIGVDSHYFVSALIPRSEDAVAPREAYSAYAMPQYVRLSENGDEKNIAGKRKEEAGWYRKLVPVNFKAYFVFEQPEGEGDLESQVVQPEQSLKHSFFIFAGPKEPALLKNYEIDDTVTYGWFAAFSWPLVKLLHFFYDIIGNYAIAIVLLTVLVRLAMMRFSRKMVLNSQMMQLLSPEIKAISEKYKDDFQAKSQAQQELFRKYNYNPFSGCLVMLIQLPVFIGLYRGLSVDMTLRDQPLIPGVNWCSNLAGPDQMWRWADDLPSFFSFLTHETGWLGPYFNLLPIISVVLMLIQQKLFTPPPTDDQQAMMQKVMTFMMVFIGVIFFKVPAGLCIYFITSTLWAVMEKKLVPPPKLADNLQKRLDELKALQAKEKEDGVEPGTYTNAKTSVGNGKTRKSSSRKKKPKKNRRK